MQPILLAALLAILAGCQGESPDAPRIKRVRAGKERVEPLVQGTTSDDRPPPPTLSELVEGGTHWRFTTRNGPVHVWIPKGYTSRRADTIIYVHGYYVNVDGAWRSYDLAKQFAASAINAMFIVCEAPSGPQDRVYWTSLTALLDVVDANIPEAVPRRRIVTIGHSGAWRTLVGWLDEPIIDTVVLLDAVYGEIEKFKKWILGDENRRLINVGDGTRKWADTLHAGLPETVVIDGFPSLEDGLPREATRARILYIKSKLGHFPLVTSGWALPMMLRTLRAKRLVRKPLAEILDE